MEIWTTCPALVGVIFSCSASCSESVVVTDDAISCYCFYLGLVGSRFRSCPVTAVTQSLLVNLFIALPVLLAVLKTTVTDSLPEAFKFDGTNYQTWKARMKLFLMKEGTWKCVVPIGEPIANETAP